jgi:hypothetical protein
MHMFYSAVGAPGREVVGPGPVELNRTLLVGPFGKPLYNCSLQCLKRVVTMFNSRENHARSWGEGGLAQKFNSRPVPGCQG